MNITVRSKKHAASPRRSCEIKAQFGESTPSDQNNMQHWALRIVPIDVCTYTYYIYYMYTYIQYTYTYACVCVSCVYVYIYMYIFNIIYHLHYVPVNYTQYVHRYTVPHVYGPCTCSTIAFSRRHKLGVAMVVQWSIGWSCAGILSTFVALVSCGSVWKKVITPWPKACIYVCMYGMVWYGIVSHRIVLCIELHCNVILCVCMYACMPVCRVLVCVCACACLLDLFISDTLW